MGAYIDPQDMTKEQWLAENAVQIDRPPRSISEMGTDCFPVCLVKNPAFSAAGIAFDARELRDLADPNDHRPKKWYFAEIEKLHGVSPALSTYLDPA